jgi:LysM repeat protein
MPRSATAAVILALLPGMLLAQETRTHTVVRGETLWDIAARYYQDGYQWTRIVQANPDKISNPDRIIAGTELVIPGAGTQVTGVAVTSEPMAPGQPLAEMPPGMDVPGAGIGVPVTLARQGPLSPTAFRHDPPDVAGGVIPMRELDDVSVEAFYSAPWLIPVGSVPARTGSVTAFVGAENMVASRMSAHPFERLNVTVEGAPPAVGSRLQTLRLDHDIRDVGRVVLPSGVLVVEEVTPSGVVARVEMQFARLLLGDLVRPLPPFTPRPADVLQPATGGTEATLVGYASDHAVQFLDDHVFIDVGGDQGVRIGDEYVVPWTELEGGGTQVQGRAKVVAVLPGVSTARIIEMQNPVFVPGVRLVPSRRVP